MYFDPATLSRLVRVVHDPRTFSARRMALMDSLFVVFGVFHTVNAVGELLDDLRHPAYRDVDVGAPIYIVAAPRSGTTFVHRLMSRDPAFSSFKLYETIFPTITAHDLAARALARGGLVSRALDRVKDAIDQKTFSGWDGMHDTGLDQDEEDEAVWALALATPAVLLLMPFPERFEHLRFIDRLPEAKTAALVRMYRGVLQRHLYRHPGTTLLMKNVLLPGRFEVVTRAAPGARFVHIVRHPYEALASMLSLFTLPWSVLAPDVHGDSEQSRDLANLMIDYYRFLYDEELRRSRCADPSFVVIRYPDLLADPMRELRRVYDVFALGWSPELETRFCAELARQAGYASSHAYTLEEFGLTRAYVTERLGDVMDHYGFAR